MADTVRQNEYQTELEETRREWDAFRDTVELWALHFDGRIFTGKRPEECAEKAWQHWRRRKEGNITHVRE